MVTAKAIVPGNLIGVGHRYRYLGGEWVLTSRLIPTTYLDWESHFGHAAAVDGNTLVLTHRHRAAFVFDWEVPDEGPCPSGEVSFLDPPHGVVDTRQPSGVSSAAPVQGIRTIEVTAPVGASRSCWNACNSVEESYPISNIEHGCDGTYVITLLEPIPAGEVTTISYLDDQGFATSVVFTSHPANANADGEANPLDLLSLINYLNGIEQPPFGLYGMDVDHSGVATPADILRLIDLLNGAQVFDVWNETPRPAIVCP